MTKEQFTYSALRTQLDEIMNSLQDPDIRVEDVVAGYQKGLTILEEMKKILGDYELTIDEVHAAPITKRTGRL